MLNLLRLVELSVEFKLDFGVEGLLRVVIGCLGKGWFFIYGFVSEVSVLVLGLDPKVAFYLFLSRWLCCNDDCFFISSILFERYLSLLYLGWDLTEFYVFTFYLVLIMGFGWVLPIDFDAINFCYGSELFLDSFSFALLKLGRFSMPFAFFWRSGFVKFASISSFCERSISSLSFCRSLKFN